MSEHQLEHVYRRVPPDMPPDDFKAWFGQLYQDLTGRPATGTDAQWQERHASVRAALDAAQQKDDGN